MNVVIRTALLTSLLPMGWSLSGCTTAGQLSSAELASADVRAGALYWRAEQGLAQRGYSCYVSGASRENFDCTKSVGFWPTCILRITYVVDDRNLVANLVVHEPSCLGTP